MQVTQAKITKHYCSSCLPLAVYREVSAHLRQVTGVETGLATKSSDGGKKAFDYSASQIESLWIEYAQDLPQASLSQIKAILDYYGDRYQPWQEVGNQ